MVSFMLAEFQNNETWDMAHPVQQWHFLGPWNDQNRPQRQETLRYKKPHGTVQMLEPFQEWRFIHESKCA